MSALRSLTCHPPIFTSLLSLLSPLILYFLITCTFLLFTSLLCSVLTILSLLLNPLSSFLTFLFPFFSSPLFLPLPPFQTLLSPSSSLINHISVLSYSPFPPFTTLLFFLSPLSSSFLIFLFSPCSIIFSFLPQYLSFPIHTFFSSPSSPLFSSFSPCFPFLTHFFPLPPISFLSLLTFLSSFSLTPSSLSSSHLFDLLSSLSILTALPYTELVKIK